MSIKLNVLGAVALESDSADCSALVVQPKRFALLVYLALDRPARAHPRDELLAMFWPESSEDHARNALNQALSFIRRTIGPDLIITRGQSVDVQRELLVADSIRFEEAAIEGDDELALSLYKGTLLPGFHVDGAPGFERWVSDERERLRSRAGVSARALIDRDRARGAASGVLHWARVAKAISPHDERAVRDEMQAHQQLGDRVGALRTFEKFNTILKADLDLEPTPALGALAAEIRATQSAQPNVDDRSDTQRRSERPASAEGRWKGTRIAAAAVALIGLAVAWRGVARSNEGRPADRGRFALILPDSARMRWEGSGTTIAISPDGSQIVYVGGANQQLYRRGVMDLTPRAIAQTDQARSPSVSPDGRWVAFCSLGNLYRVAIDGGKPIKIADSVQRYSWGDGDIVVFSPMRISRDGGLYRVSASGGAVTRLTSLDTARAETLHTWPSVLPGGKEFLFEIRRGPIDSTELAVGRIVDGTIIRLGIAGYNPRYLSGGRLLFSRLDGTLYTVPFDLDRLAVSGSPSLAMSGVLVKSGGATDAAVAANGTLVYLQPTDSRRIVVFQRDGAVKPLSYREDGFATPRLSPDGKHIAVVVRRGASSEVWAGELEGPLAPISRDGHSDAPEWSSDGLSVTWHSRQNGRDVINSRSLSGGTIHHLAEGANAFSERGGARLLRMSEWLDVHRDGNARDSLPFGGGRMVRVSPDGQWITFTTREVFVQRLAPPFDKHQISTGGGYDAVWGKRNRLYYRVAGKFVVASLALSANVAVQRVDTLFEDRYWSLDNSRFANYDVAHDESVVVAIESRGVGAEPIVSLHWLDGLNAPRTGRD